MTTDTCEACFTWAARKRRRFPRGQWGACHHCSTRRHGWLWAGEKACELWERRVAK